MVTDVTIWNDNQQTDNYRLGFSFEDEKKPEKIVLSNRDDDRGYNNPHRWEFEIVDKAYIDDADAHLQTQITTNANNIAINTQNIAANTTQLQDHENRITQNTNDILTANGIISQNTNDIAQNRNDLNALNLRVNTTENDIAELKLNKPYPLSKVHTISDIKQTGEQSYYRLHSYVTDIKNGTLNVNVEVDFYTESGISFLIDLRNLLPWLDVVSLSPYNIVNKPCCGKTIPLAQTPSVSNVHAIIHDNDSQRTVMNNETSLATINSTGGTTIDKMMLSSNFLSKGRNLSGRIFATFTFTY